MAAWTERRVAGAVYDALKPVARARSFRGDKRGGEFRRATDCGFQQILVVTKNYKPEFRVSVVLGIRLDAVETLVTPFLRMTDEGKARTCTSMVELGNLEEPRWEHRAVRNEDELSVVAHDLSERVAEVGWSYFDRFSNVAALEEAINASPTRPTLHKGPAFIRPLYGLALAKLSASPRFESLVSAYAPCFEGVLPRYGDAYRGLVESLRRGG